MRGSFLFNLGPVAKRRIAVDGLISENRKGHADSVPLPIYASITSVGFLLTVKVILRPYPELLRGGRIRDVTHHPAYIHKFDYPGDFTAFYFKVGIPPGFCHNAGLGVRALPVHIHPY